MKRHCNFRFVSIFAALLVFAATTFGDMATPSPTRPAKAPDMPPGYDWGFMIGVGLFILAGVFVTIWIVRKLSKRSSK